MLTPQPTMDRQRDVARALLGLLQSIIPGDVLAYWVENPNVPRCIIEDLIYAEKNQHALESLYCMTLEYSDGVSSHALAMSVFEAGADATFTELSSDDTEVKGSFAVVVHEQHKNGTFEHLFGLLGGEQACLSQRQVIEFCLVHRDKLDEKVNTFFLFASINGPAVAAVKVKDNEPYIKRYDVDDQTDWCAGPRTRFVVLQQV